MEQASSSISVGSRSTRPIPTWLGRYTDYALYGLVVGTFLCLFALFTNPVPDPSFPWASLPASFRLPVTQPRIEHWPVTYTIGIWLWIVGSPALFLEGYRRFADTDPMVWLVGLPIVSMFAWTTYCRFFWPKLYPPTWNAPSYTFACWLYCSSYDPLWNNVTYGVALLGAITALGAYRSNRLGDYGLAAFGILALPLGLPAIFEVYRRHEARIQTTLTRGQT